MNQTVSTLATILSTISGSFNGDSAIVQGTESAKLRITHTGVIARKGQSGCTYTGKVVAEENTRTTLLI